MKVRGLSALSFGLLVGTSVFVSAPAALAAPSPTCLAYAAAGASEPTISDATPQRGQTITVTSGDCQFDAGSNVPVTFRNDTIQDVNTATDAGGASVEYTIPCDAALGAGTIGFDGPLEGVANNVGVDLEVVDGGIFCGSAGGAVEQPVEGPAEPSGGGVALPFTGSNVVIPSVIGGLGLLVLGLLLVAAARRRHHVDPA